MDEERIPGGYGSSTGPSGNSDDLASGFIPLGADSPSDGYHKQWRPYGGRAPRMSSLNYRNFQPRPHRGGWSGGPGSGPGPNHWEPNRQHQQPFHHRRGGYNHHHRGNRNQGHQGHGSSASTGDISAYYHPSMVEDPWAELETLFRGPQVDNVSSQGQSEPPAAVGSSNVDDQESDQFMGSNSPG